MRRALTIEEWTQGMHSVVADLLGDDGGDPENVHAENTREYKLTKLLMHWKAMFSGIGAGSLAGWVHWHGKVWDVCTIKHGPATGSLRGEGIPKLPVKSNL